MWREPSFHSQANHNWTADHLADNPIFEVFYLKDAHAVIADFSGNPPKEYNL